MICDLNSGGIFEREVERSDGRVLQISQLLEGDVGCVVWDAALVLSYFIDSQNFEEFAGVSLKGSKVLELGAGTGLVGLQAAINGAEVTITDLNEFVPLMQLNIQNNKHLISKGSIQAMPFKWGDPAPANLPMQQFIFLSDCLYYEEGVNPLCVTLGQLAFGSTQVFFCYEVRKSSEKKKLEAKFFESIERLFVVEEVPQDKHHAIFNSEDIRILRFTRRPNETRTFNQS